MSIERTPCNQEPHKMFPLLMEASGVLETFFQILGIKYQTKISLLPSPQCNIVLNQKNQIRRFLRDILSFTQKITKEKEFMQYREIGTILEEILTLLPSLHGLLSQNFTEFYWKSHYFLKYYWAIHFFLARYELESNPTYYENQALFFNFSDTLFAFIEKLQACQQPIDILGEIDLEVRLDRRLPLLLTRTPDYISLSPLGQLLLKVHSISEMYYYYLYDFEEDVLEKF